MTARELELLKLKRLNEIKKQQDAEAETRFLVTKDDDVQHTEFRGSPIEIVLSVMRGLRQMEQICPEAKPIIDAALVAYKVNRLIRK